MAPAPCKVKAYLGSEQIRRFSIDGDSVRSFDVLQRRLRRAFSLTLEQSLRIAWKGMPCSLIYALFSFLRYNDDIIVLQYNGKRKSCRNNTQLALF